MPIFDSYLILLPFQVDLKYGSYLRLLLGRSKAWFPYSGKAAAGVVGTVAASPGGLTLIDR